MKILLFSVKLKLHKHMWRDCKNRSISFRAKRDLLPEEREKQRSYCLFRLIDDAFSCFFIS